MSERGGRRFVSSDWKTWSDWFPMIGKNITLIGRLLVSILCGVAATRAQAAIRYVAPGGGNIFPYTNWVTAATNIQSVIDTSIAGDVVVVSNGVYRTGGRRLPGLALTNRVVIDKALMIQSANGPEVTIIEGYQVPGLTNGTSAVRCVYATNGATLSGFALKGGATMTYDSADVDQRGGGVFCSGLGVTISNCLIVSNSARYAGGASGGDISHTLLEQNSAETFGGAVVAGHLMNCTLRGNSALWGQGGGASASVLSNCLVTANRCVVGDGGGCADCELDHCTVADNSASEAGGGVYRGTVRNSIVYFNDAFTGDNHRESDISYSCTSPFPTGAGNLTNDPLLASWGHIAAASPCRGRANGAATGRDIDGDAWAPNPDIGCDQYVATSATGTLTVAIRGSLLTIASGFPVDFLTDMEGHASSNRWNYGDGAELTNSLMNRHSWFGTGLFQVVFVAWNATQTAGVSSTISVNVVEQPVHYVSEQSLTPISPFATWATAATNIQDAINVSIIPGSLVLVSNGVYATGGTTASGSSTNRISVTNRVTVRSVNGPSVTSILGQQNALTTNGDDAVRCVYLVDRSRLEGFTLSGGATRNIGGGAALTQGGAVLCETLECVVSQCVVTGNSAYEGGGASLGEFRNCVFQENSAELNGGGVNGSRLENCILRSNRASSGGGGAAFATLVGCVVTGNAAYLGGGTGYSDLDGCAVTHNHAADHGGGSAYGSALNSLLAFNTTDGEGGGSAYMTLHNCTVVGNHAGNYDGGSNWDEVHNSIIYYNTAPSDPNYTDYWSSFSSSCTEPLPVEGNNFTNAPDFVDLAAGNLELRPTSPCLDAGTTEPWMNAATDLARRPRLMGGIVDLGCYEFRFEASLRGLLAGAWDETNELIWTNLSLTNSPYKAAAHALTMPRTNSADWVLVSVRESPTGTPVASVSAFMMPDGAIRGTDGSSNVYVEAKGNLYGVLQHRNHLAVMSAVPVFTSRVVTFDFSSDPNLLWGGTNAVLQVSTNRWGMIPGDADGDGEIGVADRLIQHTQGP